jgi:hypothetical protein
MAGSLRFLARLSTFSVPPIGVVVAPWGLTINQACSPIRKHDHRTCNHEHRRQQGLEESACQCYRQHPRNPDQGSQWPPTGHRESRPPCRPKLMDCAHGDFSPVKLFQPAMFTSGPRPKPLTTATPVATSPTAGQYSRHPLTAATTRTQPPPALMAGSLRFLRRPSRGQHKVVRRCRVGRKPHDSHIVSALQLRQNA